MVDTRSDTVREPATATDGPPPGAAPVAPPADWVPVERRLLGFDRRTIPAGLVVLVFAAFMYWGLPSIDEHTSYTQQTKAGDVIDLGGRQLTFVPAVGWGRSSGILVGEGRSDAALGVASAGLFWGDTTFSVTTGPFTGTATRLIGQIDRVNGKLKDARGLGAVVKRASVSTSSGLDGVIESFNAPTARAGLVAAFVVEVPRTATAAAQSIGVQVQVIGSIATVRDRVTDIAAMLDSLSLTGGAR